MKKLIRSEIPNVVEGLNTRPVRDLSEHITLLFEKVKEEVGELAEAYHMGLSEDQVLEELSDLITAVHGLEFIFTNQVLSCPQSQLDTVRRNKNANKGMFYTGIVLEQEV